MSYNPFTLQDKTILVTGASSGIGRATAIECSKMGATVIITARNEERLQETLSMMEGNGHEVIVADLTDEEQIMTLAVSVPQLDGVFCASGMLNLKSIKFYASKAVESLFSVNTFSAMYLIRDLTKKKKINKGASLVFVSSMASQLIPSAANGIYSASKAALEAFMRQCAMEMRSRMVRSNAILPGMVETPLLNQTIASDIPEAEREKARKEEEKYYIYNRFCKPEEVALMAVYLLSDASSFVTGSSLIIDGGRHFWY